MHRPCYQPEAAQTCRARSWASAAAAALAIAFAALIGVGTVAAVAESAAPSSSTLVHDGRHARERAFAVGMRNEGSFTASAPVAFGGVGSTADTGTLALRAVFAMTSRDADCPPGMPPLACHLRQGSGVVPGLGKVSESYFYNVDPYVRNCRANTFRVLGSAARFNIAGKGEIELAVDGRPECFSRAEALNPTQPFTITGGSGAYAGASGNGTLQHDAHYTPTGAAGKDTWVGTLVVPGLEFDVTAPTLSGAGDRTVRAPRGAERVRVSYKVTASDEVDGVVPVSCRPRSGSRFKVGRTAVSCSATDTSGNTRTAKFRVTVKASR